MQLVKVHILLLRYNNAPFPHDLSLGGEDIRCPKMSANSFRIVLSPHSSPRVDENSPALTVKKESIDDGRGTSTRASGSTRTSALDDHGVDPLSLHILKRTGTE